MAGTAAGLTYGAAKGASVVALRVLDCEGSGSGSDVIAALDWIGANFVSPAVVTMSLGGYFSSAENAAVDGLVDAGVVVVRLDHPSCTLVPSSATARRDERAAAKCLRNRRRRRSLHSIDSGAAVFVPSLARAGDFLKPRWWLPAMTPRTRARNHRRAHCRR